MSVVGVEPDHRPASSCRRPPASDATPTTGGYLSRRREIAGDRNSSSQHDAGIELFATDNDSPVDKQYAAIRDARGYEPARRLMERVFADWPRRRGEFVRDFQTRGFSARVWELALFAYFTERGYNVEVGTTYPDFTVSADGTSVAVEATARAGARPW